MLYCLLPWVIGRVALHQSNWYNLIVFATSVSLGSNQLLESLSYDNQSTAFFR